MNAGSGLDGVVRKVARSWCRTGQVGTERLARRFEFLPFCEGRQRTNGHFLSHVIPRQRSVDSVFYLMTMLAGNCSAGRPIRSQKAVAVMPGSTACTRMPFAASSCCSAWLKASI